MARLRKMIIVMAALLTACVSSQPWYRSHPTRKIIDVDGSKISVVKIADNKFDAFDGDNGRFTNTAELKLKQIKAIEIYSNCKVIQAEYIPGTWILQSIANCQ